jgi:hypothetical protein
MSMKRLMVIAALAVAQSGCVANQSDAPVQFSTAYALGSDCTPETGRFVSQGTLDVSGGSNYLLAMKAQNTLPPSRIVVIGDATTTVGGASVILSEYVYTYEAPAVVGLPAEESVATYSVLAPGSVDGYVLVNAFGPKALEKLNAYLDAGDPDIRVGVISTIKARGRLGTSSNVESNQFSFPVSVFSTGYSGTCAPGFTPSGTCNVGQDVQKVCMPEA